MLSSREDETHVLAACVVHLTDCLVKDMIAQPCFSFRLAAAVFLDRSSSFTLLVSVLLLRSFFFHFGLVALSVFESWP